MLSANFKPKRTAAASRFLATARLSYCSHYYALRVYIVRSHVNTPIV